MGKECFTCKLRESRDIIEEEKKAMKEENIKDKRPYRRIPNLIYNCGVSGDRIGIADPACDKYTEDECMIDIRKKISEAAKKYRKELEDK